MVDVSAAQIVGIIKDANPPQEVFVLGTVFKPNHDWSGAQVTIDGESVASTTYYPILISYGATLPELPDGQGTDGRILEFDLDQPNPNFNPYGGAAISIRNPLAFGTGVGGDSHGDTVHTFDTINVLGLLSRIYGRLHLPTTRIAAGDRVLLANVGQSKVILGVVSVAAHSVVE